MTEGSPRSEGLDALGFLPVRALRASLRNLPPQRAVRFGAACGRAMARLGGSGARVASVNLALAFPEKSARERARLLRDVYANMGRVVAELALLQGRYRKELLAGVRIEGLEHLAAAEAASPNGAVMVVTAHFGSWDLCAAALSDQGHPLTVVHRGFPNPELEAMFSEIRRGEDGDLEELKMGPRAVTGVLGALRRGRKLVVLADQNASPEEGLFVPFFGVQACTRSAPALIAMRREVPVLPAFVFREGESPRHVVRLFPPLELQSRSEESDEALEANVASMTLSIEEAVRNAPDHWLWLHRRWKTRPAGSDPTRPHGFAYPARRGPIRQARRSWKRWRGRNSGPLGN
ncbi:MAG: lysophospholipid acyltransferase family protein [Myxococcota bacterium]|nr:lysophospholipid acyltransferase family protein [Myxococcota bacterium]